MKAFFMGSGESDGVGVSWIDDTPEDSKMHGMNTRDITERLQMEPECGGFPFSY